MQPPELRRAVAAAISTASALDLIVDDAIVLHDSNKLTVRLLPCDVLARVAPVAHQVARFELHLAQLLAEAGCTPACASSTSPHRTSPIESNRLDSCWRTAIRLQRCPTRTESCSASPCEN